jgi:dienelactone hydrolase
MKLRLNPRRVPATLPTFRIVLAVLGLLAASGARAEIIKLKSGQVFHGLVDRDGTLVQIYDIEALRRVVVHDTKVESIVDQDPPRGERFELVQPLNVHAGEMPRFAIKIEATPWDELGRRKFRYVGTTSGKATEMTQAIIQISPKAVKVRGVDGFWVGQLDLRTVPKGVILGLLSKVQQDNQNERLRVGRFLIQAEWFPEARAELDRIARDFPEMEETVATVKGMVRESEARQRWAEITTRRAAGQPRAVLDLLKRFPLDGAPAEILTEHREALRQAEAEVADDRALAEQVRKTADALEPDARRGIEARLLEILRTLAEAPDAVRDRLEPFRKADASTSPAMRFALVESGWVLGAEGATDDAGVADALWTARDLTRTYLSNTDEAARATILREIRSINLPGKDGGPSGPIELPTLTTMTRLMRPPLSDAQVVEPGQVRTIRVHDDPNPQQPTEYSVILPPEYHPLRSYPVMVALHGAETPAEAARWLAEEAGRRGYIVIAPEYNLRDGRKAYLYTPSEHAAVELAIRDAKRRFAIDSDRVFLVGQLEGAHMAYDFGLAHPDLFAGVAAISGLPGKYVWSTKANAPLVPLYIAVGDLAPAEDEISFEKWARPLINPNDDVVYVKYFRRGLEPLPEEAPSIFDWAARRRRDPARKAIEVVAARECDARYYGIVVQSFAARRTITPEAVDVLGNPLGKTIKPAKIGYRANNVLNKLVVETSGVSSLDVWVSPLTLELDQKVEVQVNGRTFFKAVPDLADLGPFLEDLRIRGDRQQSYWLKVPIGTKGR